MSDKPTGEDAKPTERPKTPLERVKERQAMQQQNRGGGGKKSGGNSGSSSQTAPSLKPKQGPQKMG